MRQSGLGRGGVDDLLDRCQRPGGGREARPGGGGEGARVGAPIHGQRGPDGGKHDFGQHESPRPVERGRERSAAARRDQQVGGVAVAEPPRGKAGRPQTDHPNLAPVSAEPRPGARREPTKPKAAG
ncbi:MAG: hypothetical protein DME09_00225 [Candidatus Rokuibacteriota bacterium]|nr:MAG: hypothetical protein DME09_00225 [Candidatus Rokubacteria bacterium]